MARNKIKSILNEFISEVNNAQRLVNIASTWHDLKSNRNVHSLSRRHFEYIVELSYIKVFLAWERFLEEAFILFLLGERYHQKVKNIRYVLPRNRKHAIEFVLEGKDFVDWATPEEIRRRAKLFFRDGRPFDKPISSITHQLRNMKTIRNAISHTSALSRDKFKSLVRGKISFYPRSLTVGGFLYTRVPNITPPENFFDYYLSSVVNAANRIIQ